MASPSARRLWWLVLTYAAACAGGCSGHRGPPLRVVVAHGAGSDVRCASATPLQDVPLASAHVATLRLSVRRHAAGDLAGSFLCDRVLDVPVDAPSLELPLSGDDSFDLYGEAYAAPLGAAEPARLAVGALLGVKLSSKTLPDLRLFPAEQFACVAEHLQRPRAFHSATLLPDGELLVVGGLTPSASDPTVDSFAPAPLQLAGDAEIFDPASGSFIAVSENAAPAPRAFHQAALVNSTPPYQILLVGGITVAAGAPAMGLNTSVGSGTRLIPFDTSSSIYAPLTTAAASAELLTYDPTTHTATRTPFAGFTPASFQAGAALGDGIAVAGGIDYMGMPLAAMIPQVDQATVTRGLETPRTAATVAARMGATLTPVGSDTALLWGGQLDPSKPAGELLRGLGAGETVTLAAVSLPAAPPTQFHTATAVASDAGGDTTLLVTGGFVETTTNGGQALEPPAATAAARVLTVSPAGAVTTQPATLAGFVTDATCAAPLRYKPAGWEAATLLSRQRVLVSGGAPTAPVGSVTCNDCDGGNSLLCALGQAALFTAPSTLSPTVGALQVPRFGHTATLMRDGNVLITGGIGAGDGTTRVLWDAEEYEPRPAAPLYDAATGAPDPDDPIAADLAASGKSRAPAQPLSATSQCGEL